MDLASLLSQKSIGPVWPAMLVYSAFLAATTLFLLLARFRAYFKTFTLREVNFMHRLYDATEMICALAVLTGMIGTCLGLLEVLPVLSDSMSADKTNMLSNVLSPLRNVWVSTIVGLALGGLWGESLMFVLKPYTRGLPFQKSVQNPKNDEIELDLPDETYESKKIKGDWREDDNAGIY